MCVQQDGLNGNGFGGFLQVRPALCVCSDVRQSLLKGFVLLDHQPVRPWLWVYISGLLFVCYQRALLPDILFSYSCCACSVCLCVRRAHKAALGVPVRNSCCTATRPVAGRKCC
jgi:hypothetical protein